MSHYGTLWKLLFLIQEIWPTHLKLYKGGFKDIEGKTHLRGNPWWLGRKVYPGRFFFFSEMIK